MLFILLRIFFIFLARFEFVVSSILCIYYLGAKCGFIVALPWKYDVAQARLLIVPGALSMFIICN